MDVESWLFARPPWHLRIHRVQTKRRVMTVEGGSAIAREDPTPDTHPDPDTFEHLGLQGVRMQTRSDVTCIIDGSIAENNGVERKARLIAPEPNTNLMAPQTWVPQLTATLSWDLDVPHLGWCCSRQ